MKKTIRILLFFRAGFLYTGVAFAGDGEGGNWISSIFGAAASGIGGGVLGGVLGLGKKFLADRHESKMMAEKRLERAEDRKHDIALADKEIERDMKAAESNLQQAMFEADSTVLASASKSQDAEISGLESIIAKSYQWIVSLVIGPLFAMVTVVQKMIRPVLTVALVCQTFHMFNELNTVLGGIDSLDMADQAEIFKRLIYSIISMTGMAVGFWFVARPEKANRS